MEEELKQKVIRAIDEYMKGEIYANTLKYNPSYAEQIKNIKEEDIIISTYPIVADIRFSGIARFYYRLKDDSYDTKRFSSSDFVTSKYHRVLINDEEPYFKLDFFKTANRLYKDSNPSFEEWKYINVEAANVLNSVKSEIKEKIEDDIYYRYNAYLKDLEVAKLEIADRTDEMTMPFRIIMAKIKDEQGVESEIHVGAVFDIDDTEKIYIEFPYKKSKKKKLGKIWGWVSGIAFAVAVIIILIKVL